MSGALKAHHQEVSCKDTSTVVYVHMYGESSRCG